MSKTDPNLRLISDPSATFNERTAEKNVIQLNCILGQIANYCPVINETLSSESLLKQTVYAHFGFQSSGDLADMKLEHGERPEDLYQRFMAFVKDNMLSKTCGIKYNDDSLDEDEVDTNS